MNEVVEKIQEIKKRSFRIKNRLQSDFLNMQNIFVFQLKHVDVQSVKKNKLCVRLSDNIKKNKLKLTASIFSN